jgi:hypothetical protein
MFIIVINRFIKYLLCISPIYLNNLCWCRNPAAERQDWCGRRSCVSLMAPLKATGSGCANMMWSKRWTHYQTGPTHYLTARTQQLRLAHLRRAIRDTLTVEADIARPQSSKSYIHSEEDGCGYWRHKKKLREVWFNILLYLWTSSLLVQRTGIFPSIQQQFFLLPKTERFFY